MKLQLIAKPLKGGQLPPKYFKEKRSWVKKRM